MPTVSAGTSLPGLDRFLARCGVRDPYGRWRAAVPSARALLAFTAIAAEEDLLDRVPPADAASLMRDARGLLSALRRTAAGGESGLAASAVDVVSVVEARIERGRRRAAIQLAASRGDPSAAAVLRERALDPLTPEEQLLAALNEFPHPSEASARCLFDLAETLGGNGLSLAAEPWSDVIGLGVMRYAAAAARDRVQGALRPDAARIAQVVASVGEWAFRSGRNPLLQHAGGQGEVGQKRAALLSHDVIACLEVAFASGRGAAEASFAAWEEAEEFHAYVALSARSRFLGLMDFDRAQAYASAACRMAERVLADPGIALPPICAEPGSIGPKSVLATARFSLPRGVQPRRSAALGVASEARWARPGRGRGDLWRAVQDLRLLLRSPSFVGA